MAETCVMALGICPLHRFSDRSLHWGHFYTRFSTWNFNQE